VEQQLALPNGETTLVLHCCCAPCSSSIIERLLENHITPQLFFYNPNIFPDTEYERRKVELVEFAQRRKLCVVDGDYDHDRWREIVKGREADPERGERCRLCFRMRLFATAAYASLREFRVICSTLSISRWKNFSQIIQIGNEAASAFPQLVYWEYNWRKGGGVVRMESLIKEEGLYQQQYCGCEFSQRKNLQNS
jgi:predicted adenine nucleotide alpha hydrolase (AANH) superfamily ATPase